MDTSFELASTMSPKVNHQKNVNFVRKAPTVLALKKYFRRSSIIPNNTAPKNESIITIGSSSTSSNSEETDKSAIVISDSEESLNMKNSSTNNTPIKDTNKKGMKTDVNEHNIPSRTSGRLSKEKYTNIKLWVDEVNKNSKQNNSAFSEVSTILGDDNQYFISPSTNIAANSTFLKPASVSKRFDELFIKKKPKQNISSHVENRNMKLSQYTDDASEGADVINDSLLTEDNSLTKNCKNLVLEDSLELNLNDSLNSRIQRKQSEESNKVAEKNLINKSGSSDDSGLQKKKCNNNLVLDDSLELNLNGNLHSQYQKQQSDDAQETPENKSVHSSDEYEVLLDSLYGNSWREKKEDILPSSEPRHKKKDNNTKKKIPNTEKPIRSLNVNSNHALETGSNNLLRILQKERFKRALESPWARSLKNVCDSDTDSDDSKTNLPPTRLNFQDDLSNNVNNGQNSSVSSSISNKKVQTNPVTKSKSKCRKNNVSAIKLGLTESGTYSFLASLSGSVPLSKCDISALIFRNNFKPNKEELAKRLFQLYNEKIFDNAIPKDTPLEWNDRMRGTAGYCYCRKITRRTGAIERGARIVLSTKVLDSPDRVRDTLVHEMCHAVTWVVNQVADGHGTLWQSWAQRAMKTFPELPPIKRCHQYVINTKYTYRCMECGYSIGRHTKSLDVGRKRCGYCYGQFEVLINKTSKKGDTKTVPVTPRKAGGFALFVKENYATYKTTDLKHGDVMKLLSQKFADLKVDKS